VKRSCIAIALVLACAGASMPGVAQTGTYTIPVVVSQTGGAASVGVDEVEAIQAYEKIANRTGGIKGMPVHFQIYDDASSAAAAVQLTNTILAQKPQVVLGSTLSPATSAMAPFFKDGPVLYAFTPLLYPDKGSWVFASWPLVIHIETIMFRYMRGRGWNKVAILRTNDVSGQDNAKAIDAALALPENKTIVTTTSQLFNPADMSIAAQVTAIKNSGAQAVYVSATGAPFVTVLRSLSDAGLDLPIFSGATNIAPDFIGRVKQLVPEAGLWTVAPSFAKRNWAPGDPLKPVIDEFYTTLEAAGLKPGTAHAIGWDEAKITVAALRALGPNATAKQIHDWIENLHDFPGVFGNYDFRTGDQHGLGDASLFIARYDPNSANGADILSEAGGAPLRGR
jgi:branched-chain amino acid transport system substrate-binding protein